MTRDKAQKRATRARMAKTGERYTTARLYALDLQRTQVDTDPTAPDGQPALKEHLVQLAAVTAEPSVIPVATLPPRVAEPGMSDAAMQRATGKSWDEWFALLDAWGGTTHNHTEIARHVAEICSIEGWWAQNVTVGYERARGMRALHERPDGFTMNASKTFPVPVERLFVAIVDDGKRACWLDGIALRLRTSQLSRSARFDVLPGENRISVNFIAKGPDKASAQFQQERLADAEDVAHWKAIWQGQFAHLAAYLSETGRKTEDGRRK
jgi:hypothetical protein